jgi:hypothetical protein
MLCCALMTSGDWAIARLTASGSESARRSSAGAGDSLGAALLVPLGNGAAAALPGGVSAACAVSALAVGAEQKDETTAPANPALKTETRTFTKYLHPMTVDISKLLSEPKRAYSPRTTA